MSSAAVESVSLVAQEPPCHQLSTASSSSLPDYASSNESTAVDSDVSVHGVCNIMDSCQGNTKSHVDLDVYIPLGIVSAKEGLEASTTPATAAVLIQDDSKPPIVLIANRGEIARRVIRTCKRLGLETLAVFTSPDALAPHVREATYKVCLGDNPRAYTNQALLLQIAQEHGVTAIHAGYGFLSENEEFCGAVTEAGIAWLGPRAQTMHDFALKHVARQLASDAGVPVLPGSSLMTDAQEALGVARKVGYPVLLKATGGGGGMGIYICRNDDDVLRQFDASRNQGKAFFGNDGVFVEKYIEEAHHVEVQIFGDGEGGCVALGERECSIQRRHQKILEESPSPMVGDDQELRSRLLGAATALGQAAKYRSAGTVEFLVDGLTRQFYFLEVNARLQVEHGITEMVHRNIDLVEAQLRLQLPWLKRVPGGFATDTQGTVTPKLLMEQLAAIKTSGHAIEVRINGEDPSRDFQPCPGLFGCVQFPPPDMAAGIRVDTWLETGCTVSPHYDSLLAKAMVWAPTRAEAAAKMSGVLAQSKLQGPPSNLEFLKSLVADARYLSGKTTTRFLEGFKFTPHVVEVVAPGLQTSVQDWPGRVKLWSVGVPPSGPMDSMAHRLANALVGNAEDAAALEFSLQGPTLRFHSPCLVSLCGAAFTATLDGETISGWWRSFPVAAGQVLAIGSVIASTGVRGYLAVKGGFDVPVYLGSRSTFPSGKFGGYQGRYLRCGDALPLSEEACKKNTATAGITLPSSLCPAAPVAHSADGAATWEVGSLPGPHADPDYITSEWMDKTFYGSPYTVHYNSNRLGVRLIGNKGKPDWVRADGGEGGTHPSNVHDHVYALGAVNFTGDHPVVLTVDGPSLGGFVCPTTIISTEVWKIGQVRPGDSVIFRRLTLQQAHEALLTLDARINALRDAARSNVASSDSVIACVAAAEDAARAVAASHAASMPEAKPLLVRVPAAGSHPGAEYRLAGDRYIQIEYGPQELDLAIRVRVNSMEEALKRANIPGFIESSPGVRSLMIEYDMRQITPAALLKALQELDMALPDPSKMVLTSRIIRLPMAFDDPSVKEAIDKYMKSIRPEAPYLPSNIDYMADNNGLSGGREEVRRILFAASYMVMGLGDVYLGAPCAVPLDPRHRLVTTKYNPARTFTAEGTVGIGGSYMCIYPMDSPGGYQLVGRTLPIWNTFARSGPFTPEKPWLLRNFDQVQFFEVSAEELEDARTKFATARYEIDIQDSQFSMEEYTAMCASIAPEVAEIKARQRAAMDIQLQAEEESLARLEAAKAAAEASGNAQSAPLDGEDDDSNDSQYDGPDFVKLTAPFTANVWNTVVQVGQEVKSGEVLMVLEAMKMESPVLSPCAGTVAAIKAAQGTLAPSGQLLVVVKKQ